MQVNLASLIAAQSLRAPQAPRTAAAQPAPAESGFEPLPLAKPQAQSPPAGAIARLGSQLDIKV
jgi:hypothetical protein